MLPSVLLRDQVREPGQGRLARVCLAEVTPELDYRRCVRDDLVVAGPDTPRTSSGADHEPAVLPYLADPFAQASQLQCVALDDDEVRRQAGSDSSSVVL